MNVYLLRTYSFASSSARLVALFLFLFCCSLLTSPWAKQAGAQTAESTQGQIIVLPFDVELPGSYAYLQRGLASTLASRIAASAKLAAVAQGSASDQMSKALRSGDHSTFAQQLARSGADYLIIGSLANQGTDFALTTYVFSQSSGQMPKKFVQSFSTVDDAMPAIDKLAGDISESVFNISRPEDQAVVTEANDLAAFQATHPERAYRDGQFSGMTSGLASGGPIELIRSIRSRSIPVEAMDINAGDLDGDAKEDVVLLTTDSLMIYRFDDGQFRMVATVALPNYLRYHSVTLGDINKNGFQEIYISGSNQDTPDSSALEWNGTKVSFLFEHVPYYLRTMGSPGEEPMLIGQHSLANDLGGGEIYEMNLDAKNTLSEGQQLNLPKGVGIFDFALADLDGSGNKVVIAISSTNQLLLYDTAGSVRWSSPETFGAGTNFFGTLTSPSNAASSEQETAWVRTRIVVADLDGDGINDILVGNNRSETVAFMPNLQYFDGSSLSAFKWEASSLVRLWETKHIPGYIINYQAVNASKGSTEYQIFFAESETSSPFAFWNSASTFLNSYTLRVNAPGQMQESMLLMPGLDEMPLSVDSVGTE